MAYVSTFEFDIFISYAHVDNLHLSDEDSGWIDRFHEELQVRLDKRVGKTKTIKIWRDNKLDGNQIFDQTISEKIKKSAIFLALMSNGYLQSEYCKKELNQFYSYFKNESTGLVVGDRSRIFGLFLTNIPHESFPDGIVGTTSFPFHDAAPDDDVGMGDPIDLDEKQFRLQIQTLEKAIFKCLKDMRPQDQKTINTKTDAFTLPDPDTNYPVFFADVSDSLRKPIKERVENDLKAKGVFVQNKPLPPPFEIEEHNKKCIQLATSSKLSVHLFDQLAGREIEQNQTYAMKQLQICLEKTAFQLIWMPKNLNIKDIEDKIYQDFLKELEKLSAMKKNVELIRGNREAIVTGVIKKISIMKQGLKKTSEKQSAVFLDFQEKDNRCAYKLVNYLSTQKITAWLNSDHEELKENFAQLAEGLQSANALMLVCGNVTNEMILARILTLVRMIYETKAEITTLAVFLAPPKKSDDIQSLKQMIPPYIKIQLLDNSDTLHPKPEVLTPFVECIGCGGAS